MRIAVLAHGTRGDVYPLTALAAELARRGHRIRLGASVNLVDTGRRLGLDTVPIGWDTQRLLESEIGREWVSSTDAASFIRLMYEITGEHEERLAGQVIDVCAGSDAIVSNPLLEWRAAMLAKARGIPLIVHDFFPHRMNDVLPHPLVSTDPQPDAAAVRATHRAFARLHQPLLREPAARFRRRLDSAVGGSAPVGSAPVGSALGGSAPVGSAPGGRAARPLELQAYSPALVPGLTWGAHRPFVGDLRMSPSDLGRLGMSTVDTELAEWLDAGDPPAFFAFGSTYSADPADLLATIGRVCRSLGLRGLVISGWGRSGASRANASQAGTSQASAAQPAEPELRVVPYVNYDLTLPRCALVVHHGSVTITAAGVRAGLPTMVCSSSFDQPFWGAQLERLGAGVHVRHAGLTEDVLRSGMRRLMTGPVRRRAALLGERLRAEPDGTQAAADEIGSYLATQPGWE
jgi:sterol 3beta-glucosyltransferase